MSQPSTAADTPLIQSWQPLRGPFQRWPRITDTLLAVAALSMTLGIWYSPGLEEGVEKTLPAWAFLLFLFGNGALVRRRSNPEVVHAIVLVTSAVSMAAGYLNGPVAALMISLYSLGRYSADDLKSYIGVGAAIALVLVGQINGAGPSSGDGFGLLVIFVLWYVGRRLRVRGEYLRLLQERAAQLERAQLAEAEKAVAEERTRIARELHDIVAHQVSLMTVQAGAAKTIADKEPQAAVQAMASVEEAGRQALDELRHLVGVLRPESEADGLVPQRGLKDIRNLVNELERAGLSVSLTLDCENARLPARVDLSVYRIVQESLTNVLKHAGPDAQVDVIIRSDARGVDIEVTDDGRGATQGAGSGYGIAGMRERSQLLGGWLDARSLADGGFSVTAHLPVGDETR